MAFDSATLNCERMLKHLPRPSGTATSLEPTTESEPALAYVIAAAKAIAKLSPSLKLELDTSSETIKVDCVNLFLESVYRDVESNQSRAAVKRIFKHFNWLLANEQFDHVDDFLSRVQPNRLDLDTALSFMTITFAARNKLVERHALYELIFHRISAIADKAKAERLLTRLR